MSKAADRAKMHIQHLLDENGYDEKNAQKRRKKLEADKKRQQNADNIRKTKAGTSTGSARIRSESSANVSTSAKQDSSLEDFNSRRQTNHARQAEENRRRSEENSSKQTQQKAERKTSSSFYNDFIKRREETQAKKQQAKKGDFQEKTLIKPTASQMNRLSNEEKNDPNNHFEEDAAAEKKRAIAARETKERLDNPKPTWEENQAREMNDMIGLGDYEIQRKAKDREDFKKLYGVYPENFGAKEYEKAAEKLGVESKITGGFNYLNDMNIKVRDKNADKESTTINNGLWHSKKYRQLSDNEKETVRLARLAFNNEMASGKYLEGSAATENLRNELSFGLAYNETNYINSVKNNRDEYSYVTMLDDEHIATPGRMLTSINEKHPVSSTLGSLGGGTARTILTGQAVGALASGAPSAVQTGLTFAVDSGLRSLGGGDNPGTATTKAMVGLAAGTAGSAASAAAGKFADTVLTENTVKSLIAKGVAKSEAFAGVNTAANLAARKFIFNEDVKPEEVIADYGQNFLFSAFGEAMQIRGKVNEGKAYMEYLTEGVNENYRKLANDASEAARSGGNNAETLETSARNVVTFADRVENILSAIETGKSVELSVKDGTAVFEPKIAAPKGKIKELRIANNRIRESAQGYLDNFSKAANDITLPQIEQTGTPERRAQAVTGMVVRGFERSGIPANTAGLNEANYQIQANENTRFDRAFVQAHAEEYLRGMAERNSTSYKALAKMDGNVAADMTDYILTGQAENKDKPAFRRAADILKPVIADAVEKNVYMHDKAYGENDTLNKQLEAVKNGDFSALDTDNAASAETSSNGDFAPDTDMINYGGRDYTITKEADSQDGSDLWVLRPNTDMTNSEIIDLRKDLMGKNGYYSAAKKGFLFLENPAEKLADNRTDTEVNIAPDAVMARETDGGNVETAEKARISSDEYGDTGMPNDIQNDSIKYLTDADLDDYMRTGNQHTRHKKANILNDGESPILKSKTETDAFIDRALSDPDWHETKAFAKVDDRMATNVAEVGNLDISGYYLELNSSDIEHSAKHKTDNRNNQIPLSNEDIKNIPNYIVNYDDVLEISTKKDGRKTVLLGKQINGHSIIVTIASDGRKSLTLKSAYILDTEKYNELYGTKKEDVSYREATAANNATMPDTPENVPLSASSSNDIISKNGSNVNTQNPVTGEEIRGISETDKTGTADGRTLDEITPPTEMNNNSAVMARETDGGNVEIAEKAGRDAALTEKAAEYGFTPIAEYDKLPGLLQDEYSESLSAEEKTALDKIGEAIGVPIKITGSIREGSADGCYADGVIYQSIYADDKPLAVFAHEVTHYLEQTPSYKQYQTLVLDIAARETGKYETELVNEKIAEYGENGIELTREGAKAEIAADYTKRILKNPEDAMEFVKRIEEAEAKGSIPPGTKQGIFRRMVEGIKRLLARIKGAFTKKPQYVKDLEQTQAVFEDMLKEAANGEIIEADGKVQFSQNNTLDNGDMQMYNESGRSETEGETAAATRKIIETVDYSERYGRLSNEQRQLYDSAKRGNVADAYTLITDMLPKSGILDNLDKDVYLLPVMGKEGTSDNVMPWAIAEFISKKYGNNTYGEIYKQQKSNSRNLSMWERMKEDYPAFDKSDDIEYNDIKGKRFLLIDDNSTTGRTFKGLENFIRENGGEIAGYYAMTVGQDASEKYTVSDDTWHELEQNGLNDIIRFAEKEGIRREISRTGLTEREAQELLKWYGNAHEGRGYSSLSENERIRKEIPSLYGNARSAAEQIKSDTQASGFFDADNLGKERLNVKESTLDTEYLNAVKNGDTEKAANMVREQAEKNSYTTDTDIRHSLSNGKSPRSAAMQVIKKHDIQGKVDRESVIADLKEISDMVHETYYGEGDVEEKWPAMEAKVDKLAEKLTKEIRRKDNSAEEQYKELRSFVKSMRIKPTDDFKDIPDWNSYRKSLFGTVTFSKDGLGMDVAYMELMERFPDLFNDDDHMTQSDQLQHVINTLNSLKTQEYHLTDDEYDAAYAEVKGDIIAEAINVAGEYKEGSDRTYSSAEYNRLKDRYNKKLEHVNETNAEKRDKLKERERARYDKKIQKLKDKVAEQQKAARERKKEAEDKTKLLNIARRLQGMRLSPENKALLPDILEEIDTVSKCIRREGYTTADGRRVMGRTDLEELRNRYYEIKESDPDWLPDKDIEARIGRLDKKQIGDMEISDARELLQTLQQAEHEIRTHNKMLRDGKNRDIAQVAAKSIHEIRQAKGIKDNSKGSAVDKFWTSQLTPMRFARRVAGWAKNSEFEGLFKDINDGQRKSIEFKRKATERFIELTKDEKSMRNFTGKHAELIDISKYDSEGRKVYITPAMRVALSLHSRNYSNLKHIKDGGITVPDMKLYKKGRISDAYKSSGIIIRLTPSQVREITSEMTDFEKQFADAAYQFFNDDCKRAVNETSLALNGYEKAVVKDYFPITSNKNFVNMEFESLKRDGTYEGMGMLKERKYAGNPIVLEDAVKVISRHMSDVGDYYGLAVPIRNFNRVYNSMGAKYAYSTKQAINAKWGSNSEKYIENLMTDLQGGRGDTGPALLRKLNSSYAQATLSLNVGVMLQQLGSYPTAAAVIGYKPLIEAFSEPVTKKDKETMAKYTPLLWYREQGYSTRELGDYTNGNSEDWTKKGKMPWLMGWIQKTDVATTTKLWKAAEFYVRDNFKDLEKGSDSYYKKTAEIYNDIIEQTQPNYTTMQRADILRNPNAIVKAVSMFRAQLSQNFNLLYDAFGEYRARREDYKENSTPENKDAYSKAGKTLTWVITSQIVAAMVVNYFKGVGNVLKGQFNKHYGGESESDEGEVTVKSFVEQFVMDNISTLASNVWFGSDAVSLLYKTLNEHGVGRGGAVFDTEAPTLAMLNDIVDDITVINKMFADGETNVWNMTKKINKVATHVGTMFGVPAKNMENLIGGIYKDISDVTHSGNIFDQLDAWSEGYDRTYSDGNGNKYKANMTFDEYTEYQAFYEKTVEDMREGRITKNDGEKYAEGGIPQAARKMTNEKYKYLFKADNGENGIYIKATIDGKEMRAEVTEEQYQEYQDYYNKWLEWARTGIVLTSKGKRYTETGAQQRATDEVKKKYKGWFKEVED